jgi:G:T/U-mismatch repair DNA glycosylase
MCSKIRERNDNYLHDLLTRFPNICTIAFNGGTAGRLGIKVLGAQAAAYDIVDLPSSSPAYTLPYAEKALRWQVLRSYLAAV